MDTGTSKARVRSPEESGETPVAESIHSDVRMLSLERRRIQLQELLDRASEVEPAELESYFQSASQFARNALEHAADDDERGAILQLWAQLDIADAETRAAGAERRVQLQEALRKLEQAIHVDPDRTSAWQIIAEVLVKQRDANGWRDFATRLGERLGEQPSDDGVAIARGTVMLELGRLCGSAVCFEFAAQAFDRAVVREPSHGSAWLQAAYAATEAASTAKPSAARALLRAQLERLGRGIGAPALSLELIAELRRLRVRAYLALGALLEGDARIEQLASAGRELERVSVEDPRDVRVYEDWVFALVSSATPLEAASARALLEEAAGELSRGIDLGAPDEATARLSNGRGLLLRALGDRAGAADAFRRATERWPALEAAWSNWSELLLEEAAQAAPEPGVSLRMRVLEVSWRGIQALPDPKAAARLSLLRGRTLRWLADHGSAAERDARYEEARREFERAVERDPANAQGYCEVSAALVAQAKLGPKLQCGALIQKALEVLARGLPLAEDAHDDRAVSHLHDHRGLAYVALGKLHYADAVREFEHAARAWEENPEPWVHAAELACEEARSAESERAKELYTRAFDRLTRGLAEEGDAVAASRLFEARGRVSLAAAEVEAGSGRARKIEDAVSDFKRACDAQPANLAAWRSWSAVFTERALRASASEAAVESWKQADDVLDSGMHALPLGAATAALLTDRGNGFVAQAKRARGNERRQAFDKAIACFEEATQLAPSDGRAWQSWGSALAARGRYDSAAEPAASFRIAAERYGSAAAALPLAQRAAAWIEFARELSGFARRDVAAADPLVDDLVVQLEAALDEDPHSAAAIYLARGNLLREAGRYAAAEAEFSRGRDAQAPVREALYCRHNLSALLEERGRAGREWRRTQRAYEQGNRSDADALGYAGVLAYEVFGDYDTAETKLSAAVARRATTGASLQMTWTELARERAERDPALAPLLSERVRDAERFIRKDRIEQAARELALGKLAAWSRDYERAERHLGRARELDAWNAEANVELGRLLLEQGKHELARTHFARAHELAPRDLRVLVQLARASDAESAHVRYREILEQSPNHPDALLGLTRVHLRRGDAANDRDEYVRAVEFATAAIRGAAGRDARRMRSREVAEAYYARGYAQLKLVALEPRFLGVDRMALARSDFRAALRIEPAFTAARDALAKLGPELSVLHRHAGAFICALAIGLFVIAQLGFWFASDPIYQLCAGEACLPAFRLRALEFGGYCALTFGALAFVVIGLALPLRLRQQAISVDVAARPIEATGANASAIE